METQYPDVDLLSERDPA